MDGRFWFVGQDVFEVDPVRYQKAIGETGLTAYRQAVAAREHEDTFALQYARERLAVLDGDSERIVALLGGDLTRPHQFVQVAEVMAELGRDDDDVLAWCERGIAETQGRQTARLYDLACKTHPRRGKPLQVLRLRRSQHQRMPSLSSHHALRRAAAAVDAWAVERDAARSALRERDPRAFVDALLSDGDARLAWDTAQAAKPEELGSELWLRRAESRETATPSRRRHGLTSRWPTRSWRKPTAVPTPPPYGSSSALETPRRPPTTSTRSTSTSPSSANNIAGARP